MAVSRLLPSLKNDIVERAEPLNWIGLGFNIFLKAVAGFLKLPMWSRNVRRARTANVPHVSPRLLESRAMFFDRWSAARVVIRLHLQNDFHCWGKTTLKFWNSYFFAWAFQSTLPIDKKQYLVQAARAPHRRRHYCANCTWTSLPLLRTSPEYFAKKGVRASPYLERVEGSTRDFVFQAFGPQPAERKN